MPNFFSKFFMVSLLGFIRNSPVLATEVLSSARFGRCTFVPGSEGFALLGVALLDASVGIPIVHPL